MDQLIAFFNSLRDRCLQWWWNSTSPSSQLPTPILRVEPVKLSLDSAHLQRTIEVYLYLPPTFTDSTNQTFPVLFFHDGQDFSRMGMTQRLEDAYQNKILSAHLVVGIVAGDRMQEYGTGKILDYLERGSRSAAHNDFLIKELLPFLITNHRASSGQFQHSVAGCSLGGLAALYLAWTYPDYFRNVGIFSGSLWWRSHPFDEQYPDANLIIHRLIDNSEKRPHLKLWFQAGTLDETSDRNHNGVIDAIDDTLFLIKILKNLGYTDEEIKYVEIQDGRHEPATWAVAMPSFLEWIG